MVQNTNLFVLKRILLHFKIFTFCTFVQVQCAYNSLGPVCCMPVYSIARTLKCYIPLPPHCPQETCLYSWVVSCIFRRKKTSQALNNKENGIVFVKYNDPNWNSDFAHLKMFGFLTTFSLIMLNYPMTLVLLGGF